MSFSTAGRIAQRELRGGLGAFRVMLTCLALGVLAIAAVGTVRDGISASLEEQGATLLGGDAMVRLTYRFADPNERTAFGAVAEEVSEVVDFRSMAVVGEDRALTDVKAVDGAYPLYGEVRLDPPLPLDQALGDQGGLPGAVMASALADRLGLMPGDTFRLGTQELRLSAVIEREPDSTGGSLIFGPRTLVRTDALAESGLLAPGTLFETEYRMRLPAGTDLDAVEDGVRRSLTTSGARWRDRRNAAPSVAEAVERMGAFLVLTGLAGLIVGGVGVAAAVRGHLERKTATVATLRSLGATRRMVLLIYLMQIAIVAALGIAIGVAAGGLLPLALSPLIEARLPFQVSMGLRAAPLLEAALYGALVALIFSLWPLSRTERISPATLYRQAAGGRTGWPRPIWIVVTLGLLAVLVAATAVLSGQPRLTLWTAAGVAAAFVLLLLSAGAIRWLSRRLARGRVARGRAMLRLALASVGGPSPEAAMVVLSLGLGLSVLAAIGQIDANLRGAIARDLPKVAPSFFVIDIQPGQLDPFLDRLREDEAVSRVESAPMLRGVITAINGAPAIETAGDHWVLRGDRGVTYSARPPEGTKITVGDWWSEDYAGPPQISFAAEEGAELGLVLGDRLTINILGRDIEGEIASFREVDFSTAGIGFILSMNPTALQGAPHSHIATIYADEAAEPELQRTLSRAFPNISVISVRDAISRVSGLLAGLASAVTLGAGATLVTGAVVLIGAAAAGERERRYEAALLKTLGATRGAILASFALRSMLHGLAASGVAIVAGGIAGWAFSRFVLETEFTFEAGSALAIVAGGVLLTLLTGLVFVLRPLAASPARVLRAPE